MPLVAAGAGRAALLALQRFPPGGAGRWTRVNHRGTAVSLLGGPAFVAGALAGVAAAPQSGRDRSAAAVALLGAGAFGLMDDLAEPAAGRRKGLRGHLGELARGRLTTGGAKVLGISATGVVAAGLARAGRPGPGPARPGSGATRAGALASTVLDGALVAGLANLANLLDLRPGRALKAVVLAAAAGPPSAIASAASGAAGGLLRDDLAERTMLGDTGANAAGALVGLAMIERFGPRTRAACLAAVVALTLASERVSFTRVIESTPVLRELDRWGRRG